MNLRICSASAAAVLSLLREEMPSAMPMVVGRAARARRPRTIGGGCVRKYIYVYVRVYMQEKKDDLLYTCESVRSTESGTWGRRGSRQSPLA